MLFPPSPVSTGQLKRQDKLVSNSESNTFSILEEENLDRLASLNTCLRFQFQSG